MQTLNDPSDEAITQDEVNKREDNKAERVKLYRYIYKLQNRRHLYRKLFSFYRVTSALLESVTVIIVMVILMFNKTDVKEDQGSNNYRTHSFIALVEVRLAAFFGVQTSHNDMGIYVARDIILSFTLGYSFLVILTALVKYWHQAKNVSMTWMGQVVLGLYLCFLMVNKLTTAISILVSSQTISMISSVMSLAFMLLLICIRLGLVYVYKRNFSRNWRLGDSMDKWMNIFVNTCVVIPFTLYQCPVTELKAKMAEFSDNPLHRRRSDPSLRREEILTALSQTRTEQDEVLPFLRMMEEKYPSQDQLREQILNLWWKNPSRKLTLCHVLDKVLMKHTVHNSDADIREIEESIRDIIINLEVIGLINTPLLAPTPSRHEYFALFLLVLVENAVSIGVEMLSGGKTGSSGNTYYSIDIRISCLFLALAFLLAYYCK